MIWPTFKENEQAQCIELLEKYLKDIDSPIKRETYLNMCEQMGKEPDPAELPLAYEDLTYDAQLAYSIYTRLGSRIYGDVGFTGKDYTNLPILIEVYDIIDPDYLLILLSVLDSHYINKSQAQIKKMHDDIKKKK